MKRGRREWEVRLLPRQRVMHRTERQRFMVTHEYCRYLLRQLVSKPARMLDSEYMR